MINVVFLLLIFFLMTAEIAPAPPFELTLPEADAPEVPGAQPTLYVDARGAMAFGAAEGDAALALAGAESRVTLAADAALPARDLARLLGRLAAAGATEIRLATTGTRP